MHLLMKPFMVLRWTLSNPLATLGPPTNGSIFFMPLLSFCDTLRPVLVISSTINVATILLSSPNIGSPSNQSQCYLTVQSFLKNINRKETVTRAELQGHFSPRWLCNKHFYWLWDIWSKITFWVISNKVIFPVVI